LLFAGCATGPSAPRGAQQGEITAPRTSAPKTLRIASIREPISGMVFGGGGNAAQQTRWLFHVSLTTRDEQGTLLPLLAEKIPTIDAGDWRFLPDGGMEVTWNLRPNARWHDGTPLSAEDFVFGIRVAKDPELAVGTGALGLVQEATAPDPQTLVLRWSQPYFDANVAIPPAFTPLPRHLIADLYQQGDPKAFLNSSYWTTDFVGLGPYRLTEWELGSHTEAAAFDDYVLGRPKIDRIITRYFLNANTLVAAMLAGEIDLINPSTLKMEDVQPLLGTWGPQGGKVIPSMSSIVTARLQFSDPAAPWVRDVRLRHALLHLTDRQVMADTFEPEGGPAELLLDRQDPVYRLAEQRGFARYPYDVTRAERLLGESGWTRGADGIFQAGGQRLRVDVTVQANSPVNVQHGLSLQDQWRRGGLESEAFQLPAVAPNINEMKVVNSRGVWLQPDNILPTLEWFEAGKISSQQNNWIGNNVTGYNNPEFERRYGEYLGTLDVGKRQSAQADLMRWIADEAFVLPLFYAVGSTITAHRAGIQGPTGVSPSHLVGTWNVHTWTMD
jgi:peptide/nickel transport system substrate-binding protein